MRIGTYSLSWQLLKAVLSIYFAITLLVTLAQMGVEYLHTRNTIQGELASVERTFSPALATALWELNTEQLEALQQGIVDLPVISTMRVIDASGRELIKESAPSVLGRQITHTFKLSYHFAGEDVHLADVSFEAAGDVIFDRLRVGYQMILISALIKSTALTLLFLWAFRRRLGIPLQQLTDAVTAIDLDSLGNKHRLDLHQAKENELTKLEEAFNRMLNRLEEERIAHYSALETMNKGLEAQVAERTRALEQANQQLEQLVRTDPLTGAANRRHFVEQAQIEIQRARRDNTPLSLLMIDLDHFKRINDTWGHAAGDEVLRNFSRIALAPLRATDLFARLGGEEFAVLLPNTGLDGAVEVALRILEATRQQSIDHSNGQIRYNASIGAAVLAVQETSYESLLKRADAALYRAKEEGRDQVVAEQTD
ncbi:MAG: diguanylate cyclase [Rhodocyclaceae bacterium]|nr:diguanylate cyclase [Rhodocyclaceae bacterium]MDZ4214493.1 diguanylate cyclase [Rhodocyclaceae bacterium]